MLNVLLKGSRKKLNVVHVDKHKGIQHVAKHVVHQRLTHGVGVWFDQKALPDT